MIRYDESLSELIQGASEVFPPGLINDAVIVREAGGRLSLFLRQAMDPRALSKAEEELRVRLGAYARQDRLLSDSTSPGAGRILTEGENAQIITHASTRLRIIDRRIVGADWLRPPAPSSVQPRIVFTSLKGGVGRSTALCVMAAHFSRRGVRVLAVDLDFEAPGIGSMLLGNEELPKFGTIDYLVENGLSGIDNDFIANSLGSSYLGSSGASVFVVPAVGASTFDNPADALGKISRAYLEDIDSDGMVLPLSRQIADMVARYESLGTTDVTLIDARAGLHETTASAILALGADVLLFGTDQPQTFQGYQLMLAHLARFPVDPADDWRDRLQFVHARAIESRLNHATQRFRDLYRIVDPSARRADSNEVLTADDLDLEWQNEAIDFNSYEPQPVLVVMDDPRFHDFDPAKDPSFLDAPSYTSSFLSLLTTADEYVDALQGDGS